MNAFRGLRSRNYRLYFIGQMISICGTNAQTIAFAWLILRITNSPADVGIATGLLFFPPLVIGPWIAQLVDRFGARQTLFVTQITAAAISLLFGIFAVTNFSIFWVLCLFILAMGCSNALDVPARLALIRELAAGNDVANVVALNNVMFNGARIVGPSIGAGLIALFGIASCFFFNVFSFCGLIVALLLIDLPDDRHLRNTNYQRGRTKRAVVYIRETPELRATIGAAMLVSTFTYEFWVTLPIFTKLVLHSSASVCSLLVAAMSVGGLSGALMFARKSNAGKRELLIAIGLFGITTSALGLTSTLPLAFPCAFAMGWSYATFTTVSNAILQLTLDRQHRSPVLGIWTAVFQGSTFIGAPVVGWVAHAFGVRYSFLIGGVAALVALFVIQTSWNVSLGPDEAPEPDVSLSVAR